MAVQSMPGVIDPNGSLYGATPMGPLVPPAGACAPAFVPEDIAGLILDLDSRYGLFQDAAGTTPAGDNDPVGLWEDQSSAGNDVTQATDAERPTLLLATLNGQPVLSFPSTVGASFSLAKGSVGGPTIQELPITVFMVLDCTGNGTNGQGAALGIGGSQDAIFFNLSGSIASQMIKNNTGFNFTSPSNGVYEVRCWQFNGASSLTRKNGASDATGTCGTTGTPIFAIGDDGSEARSLAGHIARVLIYDSVLSETDIETVESYLNSLYAVF